MKKTIPLRLYLKRPNARAIWLGVNLITAFLAAVVISRFSDTINEIVALAVLMTIVASMGRRCRQPNLNPSY